MKKTIYYHPVDLEQFKAENVLKEMDADREKLIKNWGQEAYDWRREALVKYIKEKTK